MKTATLPPLRVEPKVRKEAERLLRPGETLSSFIEESVRRSIEVRRLQADFLALAEARLKSGVRLVPAEDVLTRLERKYRAK